MAARSAAAPRGTGRRRASPSRRTPPDVDRIVHERIRLGILAALAARESLTFNELKESLRATDGNLSVHARKLEEAGYVACSKGFAGRVPRTAFRLTAAGRRAFERYVAEMEEWIRGVRGR